MTLPGAHRAVVDDEKIRDYLLSPEHPVGRFKAAFFRALDYSRDDWEVLRAHLLQLASAGIAISQPLGVFGRKFEVSGTLEGPGGKSAEVTTIWIIRGDEDFPRFVTAYPT